MQPFQNNKQTKLDNKEDCKFVGKDGGQAVGREVGKGVGQEVSSNGVARVVPLVRFQTELLTRKEAAVYLGVSEQTLAVWKCTQRYDLPVVKIGRLVKYKKSDLDKFIENGTVGLASNQ